MKTNIQLAMGACGKEGKGGKALAMLIRVAGNEEGKGNKESNDVSDKGRVRQRG
jgi:hypothetical protein